MKRLKIKRVVSNEKGVFSVLVYNNAPFAVTAERADLCNTADVSCIPAGKYICRLLPSSRHGMCWHVMNVPNRTDILFHKGNIPSEDSEGCVLIGESFDILFDQQAVLNSLHGYNDFMNILMNETEFHLTIEENY